jgi:hypothetical protein
MINGRSKLSGGSALFFCVVLVACGGGDDSGVFVSGNTGGSSIDSAANSGGTGNQDSDVSTPPDPDVSTLPEPDVPNPSDPVVLPPIEPVVTLSGPPVVSTLPEPDGIPFEELMATSIAADLLGTVIDSPVSGLRYKSGNHYGITDSDGTFGYIQGETVEFFIGDIRIGHAITPSTRVTPYEMANSDPQVALNIARFLQSLDNDAQTDNGIQINDAVHTLAADTAVDFSSAGWQQPSYLLVNGEWVPRQTDIELLVSQLTSATEAGARDLLSTDEATSHLVNTFGEIINSLAVEAKSLMAASRCETDLQCKGFHLSPLDTGYCPQGPESVVYSEADTDITAIEMLEAERDYLIDVYKKLADAGWPDTYTRGSCLSVVTRTYAVCGATNHCEITTSLPIR